MIVGFGYQARVGKDTSAQFLERHGFSIRGFADALKGACHTIFGLNDEQLHGDLKEVEDPFWGTTPRDILQRVGTEAMRRHFDEAVWVKSLERYIQRRIKSNDRWAIPDVRFPNEAAAIKRMGGFVVRVDRDRSLRTPRIATQGHASETSLEGYDRWDYVINNNGGFQYLHCQLEAMLEAFKGRTLKGGGCEDLYHDVGREGESVVTEVRSMRGADGTGKRGQGS